MAALERKGIVVTRLFSLKDSVRDAMIDVEQLVARLACASVRPIYRDKGLRPEQVGTGSFVEVDGRDYLVTAAHVVDHHQAHTLFVGQRKLVGVTLTFHSTVAPGGNRAADKLDFAFAPLDVSWRAMGIKPIPLSTLFDREDAPLYSAIGFPNSRNRKYNPVKNTVRPTVRQFISSPVDDPAAFEAIGLARDVHLALRRDPKYALSRGSRVIPFEPRGMSGGLIFGLYGVQAPRVLAGLDHPLVVPEAIVTERSAEHHLLLGTRLVTIVNAIRQNRPAPAKAPR